MQPKKEEHKWRSILLTAGAVVLSLSLWFAGSAVLPQLSLEWGLTPRQQSWMTMSVQLGFVAGALVSALLNLADRIPTRLLFACSSLAAGSATALIPLVDGAAPALALRFLTGVFLAGVYPPGMKLVASWTRRDRGLGMPAAVSDKPVAGQAKVGGGV